MPLGTWVHLYDVLKMGYSQFITVLVLQSLIKSRAMSFRPLQVDNEAEQIRIDVRLLVTGSNGAETYQPELADMYEYMLHRRPRRRKRRLFAFESEPEVTAVPA